MLLKKRFVKLRTLCEQIRGVSYTPKDVRDTPAEGYLPILRANNIQDKITSDDLVYVNHKKIGAEQLLKEGDILICASSGSKNLVGKAAMVHYLTIQPASFGAFCKVVRPTKIYAPYLAHFFNSSYYRNTISHIAQGANINNIRNEHINDLDIPYPDQKEQKRIAERLDKVQELIALQKEQLKKLDELIKSRFIDLFGDPITNPKGWPSQILTKVSPKITRKITPVSALIWLLNLDKVESNTGRIIEKERVSPSQMGSSVYSFQNGDVLYSKLRPYLNKVVLVDEDGFCTSELLPLHPKEEICRAPFLAHLLRHQSVVAFLSSRVAGAKMPRVDMDTLRNFQIILPPISLQTQFTDFVTKIEAQKGLLTTRLSHLETLYKSLMQEYFG